MFGEFKNVYDVLKKDDRLVASDGTLMKNRIYELSSKLDETFLQLLLDNEVTKNIFFKNINGIFVFNSQKFNWIIDSKEFFQILILNTKKILCLWMIIITLFPKGITLFFPFLTKIVYWRWTQQRKPKNARKYFSMKL